VAAGFNLQTARRSLSPTDVTAFYPKGVPVLAFFTGSHEDIIARRQGATLNYEGLERVAKFARNITLISLRGDAAGLHQG